MSLFLKIGLFSMIPTLVLGQARASTSSTSSAPAATHSVNVGATGHHFTPDSLTANVGDIVEFRFYPLNHSVARAEYKYPCIPYELTDAGKQGFWSGFEPINVVLSNYSNDAPQPPIFSLLINDTDPIFFYCSAPGACEDGMVGVINPNATRTIDVQTAYARNASIAFSPGEGFPPETESASPSSTSQATSTAPAAASNSHHALSTGAIAGISIGGAAVLLLGGALVYLCGRQRTVGELLRRNQRPLPPPSYVPDPGHMSMASSAAFAKSPHVDDRYSAQGYEDETYRSRSPPMDEGKEFLHLLAGNPLVGRPAPPSPGQRGLGPVELVDEPMYEPVANGDG
ncbi:extracellular serine-rich protein [Diplocarpon rosae]|nr:extracellular serine-rich protein [Diplocarpon rosae]